MIVVDNLSKSYGKQGLFDSVSFKVNRKERVGVVGRNGHGKTTLFRMITGEDEPDEGTITKPRKYRIGYVEQRMRFTEATVLAEGARALPPDAPNEIWRVEKVLTGLGFDAADLEKRPSELSGGFQVRLNLTKVLVGDFQMLLLDEPSNYLDITSIRWLERFLSAWPGELLLITHDRSFMDNVVTHVLGIHRRKVRKVEGDTGKYYEQIAAEEEIYEKTRVNDERKMKEMDLFITRFRAKARLGGLVQSRVKSLEKMEKRDNSRPSRRSSSPSPRSRPTTSTPSTFATSRSATPPTVPSSAGSRSASGPGTGFSSSAATAGARPRCSGSSPGTSRPCPERSTRRNRSRPATSSRPTSRPCPNPTPSSRRSSRPTPRAIPSGPASSPGG